MLLDIPYMEHLGVLFHLHVLNVRINMSIFAINMFRLIRYIMIYPKVIKGQGICLPTDISQQSKIPVAYLLPYISKYIQPSVSWFT